MSDRPPIGTKVRVKGTGSIATVVPTHWQAPDDEVDVMHHDTGSVQTVRVDWLEIIE